MAAKKKGVKDDASEDEASEDAESGDSGDDDGKKDKKKDKEKNGPSEEPSARAGYIGLGLVGSLVVGFDPLRDAFQGNGSFENAIFRFLACVAVCVIGAGTIGRLIDASAPNPKEHKPEDAELDADGNPIGGLVEGETDESSSGSTSDNDDTDVDADVDGASRLDGTSDGQTISSGSASSDGSDRQEMQQ